MTEITAEEKETAAERPKTARKKAPNKREADSEGLNLHELHEKSLEDLVELGKTMKVERAEELSKQDLVFEILKTQAEDASAVGAPTWPLLLAAIPSARIGNTLGASRAIAASIDSPTTERRLSALGKPDSERKPPP